MKSTLLKFHYSFILLVAMLGIPSLVSAQNLDDTEDLETPITDQAIFYASVLVTDEDENGTIDALIGLSQGPATTYGAFSCIIRWNGSEGSNIDAHNGSGYSRDEENPVPISFGTKYDVWFDVNVTTGRYTPYVKTAEMEAPVAILTDVEFRAKGVTSLDQWRAVRANEGDDGLNIGTVGLVDAVGDVHASYNDAAIASLSFDPAGLSETWDPEVTSYTATFPFGVSSVEVSATPVGRGTSVTGTGTLDVSAGSGTLDLVATAEDGETSQTYSVDWNVNDPATDATLSSITLDTGNLSPAFSATVTDYEVSLPYGTSEVNVTATPSVDDATVKGEGVVDVSSGTGVSTIEVTSADETVTKTYTITFSVEAFALTGVTITGTRFDGETNTGSIDGGLEIGETDYNVSIGSGTLTASISGVTTNDPNAFIEFSDEALDVSAGSASTQVVVTSANLESSLTYNFTINVTGGVYNTSTGVFDPALDGTDHIVYSRIDITNNGVAIDGLFAVSDGKVGDWGHTSGGLRFTQGDSTVQFYDGTAGGYRPVPGAEGYLRVHYDTTYHCWLVLSPADTMYSAYVQIEGAASPTTIGEDAKFRFKTNTIDRWTALSATGSNQGLNVRRVEMVENVGDIPVTGTNADLSGISLEYGSLDPAFDPAVTTYDVDVPFGTESLWVEGILADRWAYVEGSGEVTIDAGSGTAELVVKAEDTTVSKTYTINFTELAEDKDATLTALTTDVGELSPVFSSAVTGYTLQVPYATATVNIGATANVAGASITGTGAVDVSSGGTFPVDVTVTAADGQTTKTYTVTIETGPAGTDATLAFLRTDAGAFDPAFSSDVNSYDLEVPFGTEEVKITYKPTDINASVSITSEGIIPVSLGTVSTVEIVVTAEDGNATSTYTIDITVESASSDASLSALSVDVGTLDPEFDPEVFAYTLEVPYVTNEVMVTANANHSGAQVSGDGPVDVTSGSATATIVVTAEDESTATYTIEINRLEASTDARLSQLYVEDGTFEPTFDPEIYEYISVVPLGTSTADVIAVLNDSKATLTGSGAVDVISGSGEANVVVTAEDGTTTNTYNVKIYVGSKPDLELGVNDELNQLIQVYPNPANTFVTVDLKNIINPTLTIFDSEGRSYYVQKDITETSIKLSIEELTKGLYFIQIEGSGSTVVKRLVKID